MSLLRIVCTIFFFALPFSCAAQPDLFPATVMQKERVKEALVVERYAVKNGVIKAGKDSSLYSFDTLGRKVAMQVFHSDSTQNMNVVYEYEPRGLKKELHYLPPGKLHHTVTYEYGNHQRVDSAITIFQGKKTHVSVFVYDTAGNVAEEICYDEQHRLQSRSEKKYSTQWQLLTSTYFGRVGGTLMRRWQTVFTYDAAGHCISSTDDLPGDPFTTQMIYKGDLLYRSKTIKGKKNYGWQEYIYRK